MLEVLGWREVVEARTIHNGMPTSYPQPTATLRSARAVLVVLALFSYFLQFETGCIVYTFAPGI